MKVVDDVGMYFCDFFFRGGGAGFDYALVCLFCWCILLCQISAMFCQSAEVVLMCLWMMWKNFSRLIVSSILMLWWWHVVHFPWEYFLVIYVEGCWCLFSCLVVNWWFRLAMKVCWSCFMSGDVCWCCSIYFVFHCFSCLRTCGFFQKCLWRCLLPMPIWKFVYYQVWIEKLWSFVYQKMIIVSCEGFYVFLIFWCSLLCAFFGSFFISRQCLADVMSGPFIIKVEGFWCKSREFYLDCVLLVFYVS